jgi:CBS domain containing-hemolysin-like protein
MEGNASSIFNLICVALLVLANGFFVAVEFAALRGHAAKLRSPELNKKFGSNAAIILIEDLDLTLSTSQLGITIASLILGWWGEHTFNAILIGFFDWMGEPIASIFSHGTATALALVLITFMHVVVGEQAAKYVAIRYPETTLRLLANPMTICQQLCRPLIFFLNASANLFLRMFGLSVVTESERVHSLGELATLISQSTEKGVLDKEEEEMLHGIFGFSETVAREVMTPRTDLVTLSVDAGYDAVISTIIESGYSRFPVTGEGVDDIVGILLARDMLTHTPRYLASGGKDFSISKIMREPLFVPGTKPIDDLLNEFKRNKIHMAIVLDEHGGVDGAVTMEDLIEEIVGDIFDESDEQEKDVVVEENGDVLVDGGVLVADLNDQFEIGIPEGDYDTIAGFIFATLGRVPKQSDQIIISREGIPLVHNEESSAPVQSEDAHAFGSNVEDINGGDRDKGDEYLAPRASITVEKVQGHRIEKVRLHHFKLGQETPPDEQAEEPVELREVASK